MKADFENFKRATSVSLLGLGLQLAFGLALLIYAVLARDHAGFTASLLVLIGAGMWLTLAVVYDQHRRERVEAMEAESLSTLSARQSAVFEENADDLRVAARRLAWMHKFLTPVASLVLAAALIGVGLWRMQAGRGLDVETIVSTQRGWAIALGLSCAIVGFIFARFVSGMAKQKVWANLRAGAAAAVAAAVAGLAITLAHFMDYAGSDSVLRAMPVALPILMIVLGAEILLNFLLNVYRPRVPGEIPRPAFDSRILGFIAAPDKIAESVGGAINYQFGFDVTGSWFYQLLSRWVAALFLMGTAVIWVMTCFAIIGPDEMGLRIRGGQFVSTEGPGLHMKRPWPFEVIERQKTHTTRRLDLGGPPPPADKAILWTNEHGVDEKYFFVQPGAAAISADFGDDDLAKFKDLSLVAIEVPLYYVIQDLEKFERLGAPATRDAMLKAIGQREVMEFAATMQVDELLGRQRARASQELRDRLEKRFAELDAGIRVLFTGIEGVHPPRDTAEMFEEVVKAQQQFVETLDDAQGARIATLTKVAGTLEGATTVIQLLNEIEGLPQNDPRRIELEVQAEAVLARGFGEAAGILRTAKADRWKKHMSARGDAEAHQSRVMAYRAAPEVFMAMTYFSTLKDVMKEARVYIVADDVPMEIRTNLEDAESTGNALLGPRSEE